MCFAQPRGTARLGSGNWLGNADAYALDCSQGGAISMIEATASDLRSRRPDCYVTADTLPSATYPPNLRAESAALCELSKSLAEAPDATVRYLLDIAHDLCGAGSAGLSLVHQNQAGEAIVRRCSQTRL
jgi:hypothetical protein